MGGPLDARDPDVFVLGAIHTPAVPADTVIDVANEIIGSVAAQGPTEDEVLSAGARFTAALYRENDSIGARTRSLGSLELLHGRAELLSEIPTLVADIGPEQVAAAAAALDPDACAILTIEAAGAGR